MRAKGKEVLRILLQSVPRHLEMRALKLALIERFMTLISLSQAFFIFLFRYLSRYRHMPFDLDRGIFRMLSRKKSTVDGE
jgi:hypothetical protein